MHLYTEAKAIAEEAWEDSGFDFSAAQEFILESCEYHEISIYYGKAIQFCADWDTSDGEQWLEDCGGIAQGGDSFGQIACRIAFATLYCAAMECLNEIEQEESEE